MSISSDDPGFFNYKGVTLDYVYAALAWQLDIADLKQLSLNGIKYASVDESSKQELYKVFEKSWNAWIKQVTEMGEVEEVSDKCVESPLPL